MNDTYLKWSSTVRFFNKSPFPTQPKKGLTFLIVAAFFGAAYTLYKNPSLISHSIQFIRDTSLWTRIAHFFSSTTESSSVADDRKEETSILPKKKFTERMGTANEVSNVGEVGTSTISVESVEVFLPTEEQAILEDLVQNLVTIPPSDFKGETNFKRNISGKDVQIRILPSNKENFVAHVSFVSPTGEEIHPSYVIKMPVFFFRRKTINDKNKEKEINDFKKSIETGNDKTDYRFRMCERLAHFLKKEKSSIKIPHFVCIEKEIEFLFHKTISVEDSTNSMSESMVEICTQDSTTSMTDSVEDTDLIVRESSIEKTNIKVYFLVEEYVTPGTAPSLSISAKEMGELVELVRYMCWIDPAARNFVRGEDGYLYVVDIEDSHPFSNPQGSQASFYMPALTSENLYISPTNPSCDEGLWGSVLYTGLIDLIPSQEVLNSFVNNLRMEELTEEKKEKIQQKSLMLFYQGKKENTKILKPATLTNTRLISIIDKCNEAIGKLKTTPEDPLISLEDICLVNYKKYQDIIQKRFFCYFSICSEEKEEIEKQLASLYNCGEIHSYTWKECQVGWELRLQA